VCECCMQVIGIDEDNARVMVSLAVGSSTTTVSQYAIKLVSKVEYDKFSKYLSEFFSLSCFALTISSLLIFTGDLIVLVSIMCFHKTTVVGYVMSLNGKNSATVLLDLRKIISTSQFWLGIAFVVHVQL